MYFITTKRMLEVCFFQHTPTFIIEPVNEKYTKSSGGLAGHVVGNIDSFWEYSMGRDSAGYRE